MKILANFRRFSFVILLVLLTANLWGQAALSGSGTEDNPYLISSAADWDVFAGNNTYWGSEVYVQLTASIPTADEIAAGTTGVSAMVGTSSNQFSGTFDGKGKTLTFNCGTTTPYTNQACAPFSYINGATIKNLIVDGTIVSSNKYAGGFVGIASGANTISNSTSNINLDCSYITTSDGDCSCGGFVGLEENSAIINFNNCLFKGNIFDSKKGKTATKVAGFLGWANNNVYYTGCYMVGSISVKELVGNFHRGGNNNATISYADVRYLVDYSNGENSGPTDTGMKTNPDLDQIYKRYQQGETFYYALRSVISGIEHMEYDGSTLVPYVSYYGIEMVSGTDYTIDIKIKDNTTGEYTIVPDPYIIKEPGDYKVTLSGVNGRGYYGSEVKMFRIIPSGQGQTWSELSALLKNGANIVLNYDYIASSKNNALSIPSNATVTIDLNGHTINRNMSEAKNNGYVIKVNSSAILTIVDNSEGHTGSITGGYSIGDGGGIYNDGTLNLTDVTITGNKVIKNSNSASGRGGGIYSANNKSLSITRGQIIGNEAKGGGGGIYSNKSTCSMTGVLFTDNQSEDKGGAIRIGVRGSETATINNCRFINNAATANTESNGGAIHMEGPNNTSSLHLKDCFFQGNTAFRKGGAFYSIRGTILAENCVMTNNMSYDIFGLWANENSEGGALCLYAGNSDITTYTMDGGSITGDATKTRGGGVYVYPNAIFNVKGNVIIDECGVFDAETWSTTPNNVQLAGSSVIHVVGPLGENAKIGVSSTGNGNIIEGLNGNGSISNFVIDNNDDLRLVMDGSGNVTTYTPTNWNVSDTWNGVAGINNTTANTVPTSSDNITINRTIIIPDGCVAQAGSITMTDSDQTKGEIIIRDGGQLITTSEVQVSAQKVVVAANAAESTGWYIISSPVTNSNITSATNLITPVSDARYDLYRFNEAVELQWENYKAHSSTDFTTLENGRGYLYRNERNHIVDIDGNVNVSDITYNLSCSGSELTGFNLIGNPYSQNITLLNTTLLNSSDTQLKDGETNVNLTGFYRLTADGSAWTAEITSGDEATIKPLEGFLVQVPEAAKKVKFSKTARGAKRSNGDNIKFTVANNQYEDVAYALFENGLGLNKIEHMNEDVPMVYINKDAEDYAIATLSDEVKQFNLNFEAKTTGKYTLKVEKTGAYSYLHLIDKVAEKDINLLEENEYSFVGSPADKADRFIVRLEYSESLDNSVFAYQSGNEIVVSGEGELQVFDVMGRLVMQKYVSGVESIATPMTTGVYILRLNDKTQKIIIK